ncbi:MAG: 2-oxoacid:acceptor oxidoreductase family protein [Candidatus Omnitrophota bacterium]
MREEFIFAGFGGQGIMLMGKLLAYAGMKENRHVTWLPSYGAEVRGGTAHSMVVIADQPISSPIVKTPSICVVMNSPSFDRFEGKIKREGLLVINRSLVDNIVARKDIETVELNATDIATELGNKRVANMIILGAMLAKKDFLRIGSLVDSLKNIISKKHSDMIAINELALRKGYEYGSR